MPESQATLKSVFLSAAISVFIVTVVVLVIVGIIAWSGSQMHGFGSLRDGSSSVENDVVGIGMLVCLLIWFIVPVTASSLAIVVTSYVLDFPTRRLETAFRLSTLALTALALWMLAPWIASYSNVDKAIAHSRTGFFRWFDAGGNLFFGLLLTLKPAWIDKLKNRLTGSPQP